MENTNESFEDHIRDHLCPSVVENLRAEKDLQKVAPKKEIRLRALPRG